MKTIELTRDKVAIVDDEDFEWLSAMGKWYANKGRDTFYAVRHSRKPNGKRTSQTMHREILEHHGHKIDGLEVDHINHDGLDNRKENLRAGTTAENMGNMKCHDDNFIGVRLHHGGRWQAQMCVKGKTIHIGNFPELFAQLS